MPGAAITDMGAYLDATRDQRQKAWEETQRRRKAKIAAKWKEAETEGD
jgi:hypothetical protein